jgi:hypothetical protein
MKVRKHNYWRQSYLKVGSRLLLRNINIYIYIYRRTDNWRDGKETRSTEREAKTKLDCTPRNVNMTITEQESISSLNWEMENWSRSIFAFVFVSSLTARKKLVTSRPSWDVHAVIQVWMPSVMFGREVPDTVCRCVKEKWPILSLCEVYVAFGGGGEGYELEWNRVHYYRGHLLAYCTSPGWWMMMSMKQSVEWLAVETEVLGENLSQCRFVHHKSHVTRPGFKPGPPRWEAGD